VEAILRRPLSLRTMEMMQQIGLVILGTLMIFVFYNDLLRLFG
jgi:regulator of sigma E protease